MSKTKLLIHIGWPKTGSSSIQMDLYLNRSELLNQRILYPETGLYGPGHHALAHLAYPPRLIDASKALFDYPIDDDATTVAELSEEDRRRRFIDTMERVKEEIRSADCSTAVLSSEAFSNFDEREVTLLFSALDDIDLDIRVFAMLRRQDELLESLLAQNEKALRRRHGSKDAIESVITHNAFDYHRSILAWVQHLGREQILLESYETRRSKDDLVSRFRTYVGIEQQPEFIDIGRFNSALSRHATEYLIEQAHAMSDDELARLENLLSDYSAENSDPEKWRFRLSPNERQSIVERFRKSNFKLALEFSKGVTDLFAEPPVDLTTPFESYPGLTEEARTAIEQYLAERQRQDDEMAELPD